MKVRFLNLLFICTSLFCSGQSNIDLNDPAAVFNNPPDAARPGVLWMWMGSNLSKSGITKDLEAADTEWLHGHIDNGKFLKEFPDWFLKNEPRPSKGRYCFTTWNYFTKDSPLVSSGLLGPVKLLTDLK